MFSFRRKKIVVVDWEGREKDEFVTALKTVLLPFLKTDVALSVPHGESHPPVFDDNFHVWIWSSPEGRKEVSTPEEINNIRVDCTDHSFRPLYKGYVIHDNEGWPIAELFPNNLYIFHDLCHFGSQREIKIFSWILEQVVAWLALPDSEKEKMLESDLVQDEEDPSQDLSPNGLTKNNFLNDISLSLCPEYAENIEQIKILQMKYFRYHNIKILMTVARNHFGKLYPGLEEQEAKIIVQKAKKLAVDMNDFLRLAQGMDNDLYRNLILKYAASLFVFDNLDDYKRLYENVHSGPPNEDLVKNAIKLAVLKILQSETKYNLSWLYETAAYFEHNIPPAFTEALKNKARIVNQHPDKENLKIAKLVLKNEFPAEMEKLLTEIEERYFRKQYSKVETQHELCEKVVELKDQNGSQQYSEIHLKHISLAMKRLEIDIVILDFCKQHLNEDEFMLLVFFLAKEKVFTKLYDLNHLLSYRQFSLKFPPSTKEEVNSLFIEAWQRRFDLIKNSFELGNLIRILDNEELLPNYSRMIIDCSRRLKFKENALNRLLIKRKIIDSLLNLIKTELS